MGKNTKFILSTLIFLQLLIVAYMQGSFWRQEVVTPWSFICSGTIGWLIGWYGPKYLIRPIWKLK